MKQFVFSIFIYTFTINSAYADFKTAEEICSNPEKYKLEIESLPLQIKENVRCKGQFKLGACSAVVAAVGSGIVSAASLKALKSAAEKTSKEIFEEEYRRLAQFFFDRWKDKAETMTLEQVRREITLKTMELQEDPSNKRLQREIWDLERAERQGYKSLGMVPEEWDNEYAFKNEQVIKKPRYVRFVDAAGDAAYINLTDIEKVEDLPGGIKTLDSVIPPGNSPINQIWGSAQNAMKDLQALIKESGLNADIMNLQIKHSVYTDSATGRKLVSHRIQNAIGDSYDRIAEKVRAIRNVTVRQMLSGGAAAGKAFTDVAKKRAVQTLAFATGAGAAGAIVAGVIEPSSGGCSEMTDVYTYREATTFSGCQPRYEFNENVVKFLDMKEDEQKDILRKSKPICEYYVNFRNKMYSDASPSTIECKRDSISATGTWKGLGEKDHHGTFKIRKNAESKVTGIEFETSKNRNSLSVLARTMSLEVNPEDGTVVSAQEGFQTKAIGAAQLFYAQAEACCSGDAASCGDAKVTGAAVRSKAGGAGAR